MTSTFSWLDYSERDQRRALDVVDLLRESSTVDELGLGTVRDAFADLLFPGTSTIQTRARYFLFVPWIYIELERLRVPSSQARARARKDEIRLIDALADSGEAGGVIGIQARKTLKRLPSNVYWNGLLSWGIRRFPGQQPQYHQSLDAFYASPRRTMLDDDGNPVEGARFTNWDPNLPPPPEGFLSSASLALQTAEADYLRERIIFSHRNSMLAFLVENSDPTDEGFPWDHPQAPLFHDPFRERLQHARNFSEAMHGAQVLYNLLLSEALKNEERIERYRGMLDDWANVIEKREPALAEWDRGRFWVIVTEGRGRTAPRGKNFVETWFEIAVASGRAVGGVAQNPQARRLLHEREHQLKGSLARLENRQALALWRGDSGSAQINFRWPVTQAIVNDILEGLGSDA